jgi:RNA polymerase sigma-54 factor
MAEMRLQQRQTAQLSAQQVMTSQLLQLPLTQLEQRIYDEVQDNPMLELVEERRQDEGAPGAAQASSGDSTEMFDSVSRFERSSMKAPADAGNRESVSVGRTGGSGSGGSEERFFQAVQHDTFHERLLRDLSLQEGVGEREVLIAAEILGNLDSDGYLTETPEVIIDGLRQSGIDADEEEVRAIQKRIWYLDPPGVAVSNLRERLLVGLLVHEREHEAEAVTVARTILLEAFDDFMNKRFDRLLKKLNLEKSQLEEPIGVITSLDPHPGDVFFDEGGHYISPDFIVTYENGALTAVLNDRSSLSVRVSDEYREVLSKRKVPKEDRQFMRQKLLRANEFAAALQIRRQTLLKVMEALLVAQAKFFIDGPRALQPLVMKTVAEETGYDISTISRAVNGKYVQTRFGVFELKYFFSGSLSTDEGEELSSRIIKQQLRELIEAENHAEPLSDDRLGELLGEKGVKIARRTVAKYREQMQIPVARLRKKIG